MSQIWISGEDCCAWNKLLIGQIYTIFLNERYEEALNYVI